MMKWKELSESDLDHCQDVIEACIEFYKENEPQARVSIRALEEAKRNLPTSEDVDEYREN